MAAKKSISFATLMNMKEDEFIAFVKREGKMPELEEIASRSTEQKVYPRIKVKNENPDAKTEYVYVADKSKKPAIKVKPITFFEVKTAFANEVLHLEKKGNVKKPTFRERIAEAAQNA